MYVNSEIVKRKDAINIDVSDFIVVSSYLTDTPGRT